MEGVGFEWTVRFGDILTMGGAAVVALGIFYRRGASEGGLIEKVDDTLKELSEMKEELKGLAKVITEQAVQQTRLNEQSRRMTMIEQWIDDLRRGKGYVQERNPNISIDREY